MEEIQTLKFFWLKYEISAIQALINNSPGIDSFVFSYFFAATDDDSKPLQLISYAHMSPPNQYSSYYDTLEDYNNNALELSGPLIMSNNIISLADMLLLINTADPDGDKPDYLVFIPNVNDTRHIYYDVNRYKRSGTGDVHQPDPSAPINTNPSPPATIS
ncbi:hypothetical protein SAMN05421821_103236 [Mucilaginibacter lappiensis]|uniref:Uncharacterized protein n=1 Tax=Mucilaginibacter lappiensis TaxID=354630 RepID=A0ABR6PGV3_9SPHI|nr:hypothetical protein [Mucilaginibacter lappiensis]MBB6108999.1 hypothetical protein [Mucilaginibacter lappiensis]SIQ71277.1 hypothetical protein SAMN05421821_103236 [Mucilaginibacter lappiensis]